MKKKIHFKIFGVDYRLYGQTQDEYSNQALCGLAGVRVTYDTGKVNCKLCLNKLKKMKTKSN